MFDVTLALESWMMCGVLSCRKEYPLLDQQEVLLRQSTCHTIFSTIMCHYPLHLSQSLCVAVLATGLVIASGTEVGLCTTL